MCVHIDEGWWFQNGPEERQKRIHPALKKLIGKEPQNWEPLHKRRSKYRAIPTTSEKELSVSKETTSTSENEKKETVSKVPRYVPPKTSAGSVIPSSPRRGMCNKMKKRWESVEIYCQFDLLKGYIVLYSIWSVTLVIL
jgi:hypothetical protein